MRGQSWLLSTVLAVAVGGGGLVAFNIAVDIYGLYRDTGDRQLIPYGNPRIAKYLLSARYVPSKFNAVLIGSSVSSNWNMAGIRNLRVYNESISGANIIEEEALAEQVVAKPGIRTALLVIHPYLTDSHEFKSVPLTPSLMRSALGSESLWEAYKQAVSIRFGRGAPTADAAGTERFEAAPAELNPTLTRLFGSTSNFEPDPIALNAYHRMVALLRSRDIEIVWIVPPLYEDLLKRKGPALAAYTKLIQNGVAVDRLIDFTSDEYVEFRSRRANFTDGVHLVPSAAEQLVSMINTVMMKGIAGGALERNGRHDRN